MTNRTPVSIAMAVYNGEKYIDEQIRSILAGMCEADEMIISYNESKDGTWAIIQRYMAEDSRIVVLKCEDKGVVPNFENAILHCSKPIIMLADQDDVWCKNKIDIVARVLDNGDALLALHSKYYVDKDLNIDHVVSLANLSCKTWNILASNRFTGCCMAFKRELIPYILPLSRRILHDWWIALIASRFGKIAVIDQPLIHYRRHGENESSSQSRSIGLILRDRCYAVVDLTKRILDIVRTGA